MPGAVSSAPTRRATRAGARCWPSSRNSTRWSDRPPKRACRPRRLGLRLEKSAPVYAELFDLLEEWALHVPPKTPLGKAIAYARNRYVPLGRFLENGRVPVDNGEVERLIRLFAVACQASSSGRSVRSNSSSGPSGRQPAGGGLAISASPALSTRSWWVSGV